MRGCVCVCVCEKKGDLTGPFVIILYERRVSRGANKCGVRKRMRNKDLTSSGTLLQLSGGGGFLHFYRAPVL